MVVDKKNRLQRDTRLLFYDIYVRLTEMCAQKRCTRRPFLGYACRPFPSAAHLYIIKKVSCVSV